MSKQQETLLQQFIDFIKEFESNPFQDYYIMLVFRFIIYLYVSVILIDILMGHQKPNIKTRVLRKFQIVYGGDILKQMDNRDMQQLEVTISNTILNATKELKPKSHHKVNNDSMIKENGLQSQRRSLKVEESSELSGSSLSKKSSKLRFDLQKNQYFDPPKKLNNELLKQQIPVIQEVRDLQIQSNLNIDSLQVEGQCQQQKLSPTSQQHQQFAKIKKPYFQSFQQNQYQPNDNFTHRHVDTQQQLQQANIKYPQEQINAMNLQIQQKQANQLQDILHLSDDMLNESLKENSLRIDGELPSVFKVQSTNITQNIQQEIDI